MDDSASLITGRIELIEDLAYGKLWTGPSPTVRGTDFPPLKEIRVEVSCRDGKNRLWKSSNEYLVSAQGMFDTATTAAVGEGYYGIAKEGPFTSMLCQDGPYHSFAWHELTEIDYEIVCYDGSEKLWSTRLARSAGKVAEEQPKPHARVHYFDDNVTSLRHQAVLALRSHGVQVLLEDPRLTPVEEGAEALPTVLVASGRASARALEIAIRWPHAQAVVLFSGGGLRFDPFEGEESEHIALDHASLRPKAEGILITRAMYAEAVADRAVRDKGRIEVEKIACPVYMFSGADDQIWPSSAFSELIAQRRKLKGCPYPTYHQTFEGVGHDLGPSLGPPSLPTTERTVEHPETGFHLLLGGKPGRQARARRQCWESLLSILAGGEPQT